MPRREEDLLGLARRSLRGLEVPADGVDARERRVIVDVHSQRARPAQLEHLAADVPRATEVAGVEIRVAQIGQDRQPPRITGGAPQVVELLREASDLARGEPALVKEGGEHVRIAGRRRRRIDERLGFCHRIRVDPLPLIKDRHDVVDRPRRRHERAARESRRHLLRLVNGHGPLTRGPEQGERQDGQDERRGHRPDPPRYGGRSSRTCWTETAK